MAFLGRQRSSRENQHRVRLVNVGKERREKMQNEGVIHEDTKIRAKSEMIRQIRELGPTTPQIWEKRVFEALTGRKRDEIDWEVEDNQAGYYLWIRSFDELVEELIEDGYVRVNEIDSNGRRVLAPLQTDPGLSG
jgi:hypothetical protein